MLILWCRHANWVAGDDDDDDDDDEEEEEYWSRLNSVSTAPFSDVEVIWVSESAHCVEDKGCFRESSSAFDSGETASEEECPGMLMLETSFTSRC